MRLYKYLLLILTLSLVSLGCERDDICAEGTPVTPFLVIKFFDQETRTDIKRPSELQVRAIGQDSVFNIGSVTDSILIPLRTNMSSTVYEFTINSDTTNGGTAPNTDTITFEYNPVEEYVSSACGFKVNFEGIEATQEVGDTDKWIEDITEQRNDVTDEATAHIFIFH